MKKRIRRKLEKRQALAEFANMDEYCDECGAKFEIKDRAMTIKEDFFGEFTLKGFHPVCPNGCEELFTNKFFDDRKRMISERIHELLLKNYPLEKYEYISIDKMAELENCTVNELLNRPLWKFRVFYIVLKHKRYYLAKSYELYKKDGHTGWFNLTCSELKQDNK